MTPAEYYQLKAFARIDGALVALLWTCSFICYIIGFTSTAYGMAAIVLLVATPFYVARRLRRFRDVARAGIISFARSWAYTVLVFFYGAVLLAVVHYVYFAYLDRGYVIQTLSNALASPQGKMMVEQYGIGQTVSESMEMLREMRPIDYALNILTLNIMAGVVLGLPIAAFVQRKNTVTPNT